MVYAEHGENYRVIEADGYKFRLENDRQTGLWSIEPGVPGPIPVAFRGHKFTRAEQAAIHVKNWIDSKPVRQAVYKNKKD